MGAAVYCDSSTFPIIDNSTIVGNRATTDGGGVYCGYNALPVILNSTVAYNTAATNGGGIYCTGTSSPSITNVILAFNSSGIDNQGTGTPTFSHSCVFGNTAYDYNNITDPTGTEGNISVDPLFVRNADVGADGQWGTEDDDYGDLHLRAGSPCIDAGDDSVIEAGWVDMDGGPRVHGAHVDMGADEFLWGDFNGDGSVNLLDIDLFVRCTTGPAIAYDPSALPEAEPGCTLIPNDEDIIAADVDADGDVDQSDFGLLQTFLVEVE